MRNRLTTALASLALVALTWVAAPGEAAAPTAHPAAAKGSVTRITYKVAHCEGCEVHLQSDIAPHYRDFWQSRTKRVHDGTVTFLVPTGRTRGLSVNVAGTWELRPHAIPTGYATLAVTRYANTTVGQHVGFTTARSKKHGEVCWAGTTSQAVTMDLAIRKVRVRGTTGMTDGTIAWLTTARDSMSPMLRTYQGIAGTQEMMSCGG